MAFSKFDPHRPDDGPHGMDAANPQAERRAKLLKYGWWITIVYTAIGFLFLGLFWLGRFP